MRIPVLNTLRSRLPLVGLALLLAAAAAQAQPSSGGPAPGSPAADPTATPLDGGASLLLAGGVGYALKRLRQRRRLA
ncbi:hypothetical protein Q5H92_23175 [Hymenobacter sp. M29]|uniref:VPDSG-CTERM protein sorting domain-containing protein n=1 Tax=Hymenobacter mellowenesis TaxID=3063995 RepID=A0ABT9AHD0_9BACT|nr:hypothetical protein [Hymenobacter sp. M29]MDO7849285.1 hypothetical protein [Hymenobacter sp. M29]